MNHFLAIGRWFFALPFIAFGVTHFMDAQGMASTLPLHIPFPVVMVYLSGLGLIAGGASLIFEKYDKLGAVLLSFMLLLFVGLVHMPGATSGGATAQISMAMMLKDLAIMGGCMMYAYYFAKDKSFIG
jgi:uncharacterized membrane protein YphA (DoxX/SURF4 family)